MTTWRRARRIPVGAEVALGFAVAAGFFALVAVAVATSDSDALVVAIGVVAIAAIVLMVRFLGVAYAVPAGMAGLLAYDWFQFPPTHPHEFPRFADLLDLLAYLAIAALVGELAAYASRRADVSDEAHGALVDEQTALRRVATLVARGAPPGAVFAAVAEEVGELLEVDGTRIIRFEGDDEAVQLAAWSAPGYDLFPPGRQRLDPIATASQVFRSGHAIRTDDYERINRVMPPSVQRLGIRSVVGAPIVVDGRVWGAMLAWFMHPERLPDAAEARLVAFTELVATAVSNTASREELARLAAEQAALRRVATLVAHDVPPAEVFGAVAREVGLLLDVDATHLVRYELDGMATGVGSWSRAGDAIPVGARGTLEGESVVALVRRSGRPARMHSYDKALGPGAAMGREMGLRSSVGAPIVVDQQLWGVTIASSKDRDRLPADTESRMAAFTELVATAISNTEARTEAGRLAEEQAALRRVATLVARAVPASELFGAVAEEVGRLLGADLAGMIAYGADDTLSPVATWAASGAHAEVRGRWPLGGSDLGSTIARTGRPARIDDYDDVSGRIVDFLRDELGARSSVGSPIVVEGRVWGALVVHSTQAEPFPADTESRILNFTELVATAMSNAEARAEVRRLADEQAALRRVATLVAREASPDEVFAAVAREVGRRLGAEVTTMLRYEEDGTATVVASGGEHRGHMRVGERVTLEGDNIAGLVRRTGRPARFDDYAKATGPLAASMRERGVRSAVGTPIVVDGRLWGAMVSDWPNVTALPAGTESRMGEFTELVATAISNIEARSDLAASRARIVAATDEERRRVVRDLHDGAQQRLVHTVITLKHASRALQRQEETAPALVAEALQHAERATAELRELSHGILPAVLIRGGLRAGVDALASRTPVPVEIGVSVGRLPAAVEATAYFVVAEALTNVAKHAHAGRAAVTARVEDKTLRVQVRDDGVGGARPDGSGLVGLADRLAVLHGRLRVESPAGGGTLVAAAIPVAGGLTESPR